MTALSILRMSVLSIGLALSGPVFAASNAGGPARPGESTTDFPANGSILLAQADCSAAAAQAAAQTGGQVLSVSSSSQGGQTVCVVTVLIPGQGGERPRRTTITLPG